jgi:hypothetical protein
VRHPHPSVTSLAQTLPERTLRKARSSRMHVHATSSRSSCGQTRLRTRGSASRTKTFSPVRSLSSVRTPHLTGHRDPYVPRCRARNYRDPPLVDTLRAYPAARHPARAARRVPRLTPTPRSAWKRPAERRGAHGARQAPAARRSRARDAALARARAEHGARCDARGHAAPQRAFY